MLVKKKFGSPRYQPKKGRETASMGVALLLRKFSVLFSIEIPVIRTNITFTCISYHLIYSAFQEIKHSF